MEGYYFFPALAGLLAVALVLSSFHPLAWLACLVLALRIFYLNEKRVTYLALAVFLLTGIRSLVFQNQNHSHLSADQNTFQLQVDRDSVKVDGDRLQFYAQHQGQVQENLVCFYTLKSPEEKLAWQKGDLPEYILAQGDLAEPSGQRNFYLFDYKSYLKSKKIFWTLDLARIQVNQNSQPTLADRIKSMRYHMTRHVDQKIGGKSATYINMLIFSDRRGLDPNIQSVFQELGVVHLLTISGLQISFYIQIFRYLFLRSGLTRENLPYTFLILLTFYGFLTAWSTSVFRAIGQAQLKNLKSIFLFPLTAIDIWSIILLLALCFNPLQLTQLGFQLSYSLSLILLILRPSLDRQARPKWVQDLQLSFVMMVVSQIFIAYHQHEIFIFSFFFNVLLMPIFIRWIMPTCLVFLCLSFLPFPTQGLFQAFDFVMTHLEELIYQLNFRFGHWVTGRMTWIWTLVLVLAVIALLVTFEKGKRWLSKPVITSLAFVLVAFSSQSWSPYDQVVLIDVGQGDAILIKKAFGQGNTLIDTGGQLTFPKEEWQKRERQASLANRTLLPALKALGVGSIDRLIITHADHDHAGELEGLAKGLYVKELILSQHAVEDPSLRATLQQIQGQIGRVTNINQQTGTLPYRLDPSAWIIWPHDQAIDNKNNASIVIYGKVGSDWWLFTGDIESEVEYQLLQKYPNLKADMLKVAHHGSQTSSTDLFLDQLNADHAFISAGENNRYNHPHPEVVDRLLDRSITVHRTDQQGAVRVSYMWGRRKTIESVQ